MADETEAIRTETEDAQKARRKFLKRAGQVAVTTPAVTLLLAADGRLARGGVVSGADDDADNSQDGLNDSTDSDESALKDENNDNGPSDSGQDSDAVNDSFPNDTKDN